MNWSQETSNAVFACVNSCLNGKWERGFRIELWLATKIWSITTITTSSSTAKPNIHGEMIMLHIWWGQLGVVYSEQLQSNKSILRAVYWRQLMRLSRVLQEEQPQYAKRHNTEILQHDNARPHVAAPFKTYLETLKYPTRRINSPEIAPSDRCNMAWLTFSITMKSKNGSMHG